MGDMKKNNIFESIFKNDYKPKGNGISPYGEKSAPINFGTPPTLITSPTNDSVSASVGSLSAQSNAIVQSKADQKSKIGKIIVFAAFVIILVILLVYLYNKYYKKQKKTFSVDRLIEDYKTYKEAKL